MKKNRIRLTESQLHRVINESMKKILNESVNDKFVREILSELQEEINHIYGTLEQYDDLYSIGLNRIDGMIDLLMELRDFLKDYDAEHDGEPYKYHKGPREKYWGGAPIENNISN